MSREFVMWLVRQVPNHILASLILSATFDLDEFIYEDTELEKDLNTFITTLYKKSNIPLVQRVLDK